MSFPQGFTGLAPDESHLFEVKSHVSLTGTKMDMHFTNASTQQPVVLDLHGTFFERKAEIMLNGQVVGRISESTNRKPPSYFLWYILLGKVETS